MGFRKNTANKLGEIEEKIDKIAKENLNKALKYDQIMEYLNDIKIEVKNKRLFLDKNGSVGIEVEYSLPKVVLKFDDQNHIVKNKQFVAINMLNLISFKEMDEITDLIVKASNKNKS